MNTSLADARRAQLDNHIADLECALQIAKAERNGLAPISKLPPEVLSQIFLIIRDADPENRPGDQSKYLWSNLKVSHICQDWRQVAYGCAQLWSVVNFTSVDMALQCIKLSKQTPLRLIVPSLDFRSSKGGEGIQDLSEVIRTESHRLHSIKVPCKKSSRHIWNNRLPGLLATLTYVFMPALQTFEFWPKDEPCPTRAHHLSPEFLTGIAPQLQHLKLRQMHLPWTSPLFSSGLTTLVLEAGSTSTSTSIEFFNALKRMSALSILKIDNLPEDLTNFSSAVTVQLPRITELEIRSSFELCTSLLGHIVIPLSANIRVIVDVLQEREDEVIPSLFSALMNGLTAAWLSNPLSTSCSRSSSPVGRIRSVHLDFDELGVEILRAWSHDDGSATWDTPPQLTLAFIPTADAMFYGMDLTDNLIEGLVPYLQDLESFASAILLGHRATPLIAQLPMLNSLYGLGDRDSECACADIFKALYRDQGFRRLRNIFLEDAFFQTAQVTQDEDDSSSDESEVDPTISWPRFMRFCMSHRTVDDLPLKSINFRRYGGLDRGQINELIEAVKPMGTTVQWSY
ncbi:hypothetical protein BJ165DRAFT_1399440 [Panaeolus papilionaceus]|nr:hypothetical protein BJ165DRAFT_1399440 [Panaeolus papilionaceus]